MSPKTHIYKHRPKVAIITLATALTLMCFISQTTFAEEEPDQGTAIEVVTDTSEEVFDQLDDSAEEIVVTTVPENTDADIAETTSEKTKKKSSEETETTTATTKKSKKSTKVEENAEEVSAETTAKKSKKSAETDIADVTGATETTTTQVVTAAPVVETTVVTTTTSPATTTEAVTETTIEVTKTESIDESAPPIATEAAQADQNHAEAAGEAIKVASHDNPAPEVVPGVLANIKPDDDKESLGFFKGCAVFAAVISFVAFMLSVGNVASREERQDLVAREKHLYKTANTFYDSILTIKKAYSEGGKCPPEIEQAVTTALAEFDDEEVEEFDKNK